MRKILLPLEQTERSLKALQYFKKHYGPSDAGAIIVMVDESIPYSAKKEEEDEAIRRIEEKLDIIKSFLDGYDVVTKAAVGKAGSRIVKIAREYGASVIAMTKSSRPDMLNQLGRTAEHVILNAPCNVVIVNEVKDNGAYKGLVYTKAQSIVNLRGQIGNKQSECLLPSVEVDCNYHIEVTVGKVRFFHTSYNSETCNWDLPPAEGQVASVDVAAGESVDIRVNAGSNEGKADRIRIVNRGIKDEAVFSYRITPLEENRADVLEDPILEQGPSTVSKVVLASQNKNKIKELNAIFEKYNMPVISRDEAGLPGDEVEETGETLQENSLIKAEAVRSMILAGPEFSEYRECPVVADDTGLMVDALDGAPGVYSARYAGEGCTYDDNCNKLLQALEGVPYEKRTAHFETVITVLYPDGRKLIARGECRGHILDEKRGTMGFGYDPLFVPEGYEKTFAEMGDEVKNAISHRAKALEELERLLNE